LVSKLASDGLITRTVDPDDRRVGRLRLTESAQQVADASRAASRAALSEVIDGLDADQVDALTRGLAVMAEMTRELREEQR
jgi:DNA-binding MarR family transcriptional regulator